MLCYNSIMRQVDQISSWQLSLTNTHEWCWFDAAFTPDQLASIITLGTSLPAQAANLADRKPATEDIRRCTVSWIAPETPDSEWLFRRLTDLVTTANSRFFDFAIDEIEPLQFTEYNNINDHYTWHKDMLPHMPGRLVRKLSFILMLSDPQDHDGGDVELWFDNEPVIVPPCAGKIIFFPSYCLHRVTPITRGQRRSLVGWVKGPSWK